MKFKKLLAVGATLAVSAFTLAACGSKSGDLFSLRTKLIKLAFLATYEKVHLSVNIGPQKDTHLVIL